MTFLSTKSQDCRRWSSDNGSKNDLKTVTVLIWNRRKVLEKKRFVKDGGMWNF